MTKIEKQIIQSAKQEKINSPESFVLARVGEHYMSVDDDTKILTGIFKDKDWLIKGEFHGSSIGLFHEKFLHKVIVALHDEGLKPAILDSKIE